MQQPPNFWRKYSSAFILGLIIVFYLINGIYYLNQQSITSDEGSFMDYAIRFLKGHPDRTHPITDNSKMPISILNTIPRVVSELTTGGTTKTDWGISDTRNGRYVTLALSVLTILLVFTWSRDLYGTHAGIFSAFLASLCPNSIAHASLVTTDSYSVLFLLASMYFLWKFCRVRSRRYFILFCLAVAISQLVKQSLFHLYVLSPFCLLVYFSVYRERMRWGLFARRLLVFALISLLVINAGYYFHQSFVPLGSYDFMSNLFQGVQQVFPGSLPLPFPKPFADGLDMAKYYDQVGGGIEGVSSFGKPTILGAGRTGGSFWYYYFVSIFYKTPITYLLLFAWSLVFLIRERSWKTFVAKEFFLLAPVIYFLLLMSFFYKTQCGLRHIIFVYPFLFILSGSVLANLKNWRARVALIALTVFLLGSVLLYWGNYYPYTNEFIPDKKTAFRKVGAANLEFHQGYYFAERYLEKHPAVEWAPPEPKAGRFLISTEDYEDVWNRGRYSWIRKFDPIDHVAYNYLLIQVDEKNLLIP